MKKSLTIGAILVAAILLVAVGYAAVTSTQLNISGTAKANVNTDNFVVKFTGVDNVSDASKVTASVASDLVAKMDVEGLNAKNDSVSATYTITNSSEDLSAELSIKSKSITNEEYFSIATEFLNGKSTLKHGESGTVKVTITLIKTPIDSEEKIEGNILVGLEARPVQPE